MLGNANVSSYRSQTVILSCSQQFVNRKPIVLNQNSNADKLTFV